HERVPAAGTLRSDRIRGDVRIHAKLPPALTAHRGLAAARGLAVRPHVRPPELRLHVSGGGRAQLDGRLFLQRRQDAVRRSAALLPGRPGTAAAMASRRSALRAHRRALAGQSRRPPAAGAGTSGAALWSERETLAPALADVLHGLRRAMGL